MRQRLAALNHQLRTSAGSDLSAYPLGTICIMFKAENEIEGDKRKKAAKWGVLLTNW